MPPTTPPPSAPLAAQLGFSQPPLFCIDGSAYIFRSFFALPNLSRSDGHPTNALFLVLRMLFGLLKTQRPEHIIFFVDGPGPNFRHQAFPEYKAQRDATPEGLLRQMPVILKAVELLGVRTHVSQGCEADDCIASLATQTKRERPVVIVGSDKDLRQLLDDGVVLWDPMSTPEKLVTKAMFQQETGLSPEQWPDVQALVGDTSDNIPGVSGIGPKTALAIFKEHPTLEAVQAHLDALKPSVRAKLAPVMDKTFLYRTLTTLDRAGCAPGTWKDFPRTAPDRDALAAFLQEWELRSLAREFQADPALGFQDRQPARLVKQTKPAVMAELSLFQEPADTPALPEVTRIAQTEELPDIAGRTIGLALQDGAPHAWIDDRHYRLEVDAEALAGWLRSAAAVHCPDVKALLRACPAWIHAGIDTLQDTSLAAYLLDPEERDYALPRLLERLGPELDPAPPAVPAAQALALGQLLARRVAENDMAELMRTLEAPLLPVLASMEATGIAIDRAAFREFLQDVTRELDTLERSIHQLAGRPFNIRSSLQLAQVLFTDLKLAPAGKTPGGKASTSQEVLDKLAGAHPVVQAILDFRKLEKLRSTYLEPLPRLADEQGVIRTTFHQVATATGRLSSSNPNLQNIPIRGEHGTRMRQCFVARPGALLVAADYSQIELRVLAHMSGDPTLIDAFRHGADIHARTAALLFDKPQDAVTPDERRNAKTINFGLIYGMGPQSLAQELHVSLKDAKAFIARYFEKLARLKAFYDEVEEAARRDGFVLTLARRRRLLPQIHSQNAQVASQARRQAVNTRIQGSAADIIKLAMLAVFHDEELRRLGAAMLLQVHDELVLEVPGGEDVAATAGRRLQALMAGVLDHAASGIAPLDVPLVVDWGMGRTWADAH
ncbi:DNA polymerase I [Megalodesulfovibrio gigas]|uniref:DNA polymerase I n=1 Tax=Megalodesulfovibrio gigas (strain ATCC 19364 / DSM 1382 / NCIMB 9332 / VKM B-1759) TaxID=1121448 RepID=T2G8I4_MEGG1|nr:DNA polymerase I [Megalodesulfovibrio gigas]AGW12578.1 putative DNA polymerase I [Megalodesulfovibrio gigas DSM 1382 = ATCC 19364]